jgi:hypothetical protein
MKIAYSRQAMHDLLALQSQERKRAVGAAQALADVKVAAGKAPHINNLLSLADGSEFRLAPYSATGDLVVTQSEDTLIVVALSDVIGSLRKAAEQ